MRLFRDRDGDTVALEGGVAVCWTPGRGWGGSPELASSIRSDERAIEIPPTEVEAWLARLGAPIPNFSKTSPTD